MILALMAGFLVQILELLSLAGSSSLNSHLPLIPAVSAYLIVMARNKMPDQFSTAPIIGLVLIGVATSVLIADGYFTAHAVGKIARVDALWPSILSLVLFFLGGVALLFGRDTLWVFKFPLLFLFLMVPMPTVVDEVLTVGLQYASAEASYTLIQWSGTPVFRDGLVFSLPRLTLEVAEECSGLRSSLVLFITSLLAGHMFLDKTWKKVVLALLVLPIGVLRNAVRILTIALLTIHVDPNIIDGPLHHRGGPVFFVLSLCVLFASLLLLHGIGKGPSDVGTEDMQ